MDFGVHLLFSDQKSRSLVIKVFRPRSKKLDFTYTLTLFEETISKIPSQLGTDVPNFTLGFQVT